MGIEWKDETKEKPDFDVKVLGWHDCPNCRKNIRHTHNCLALPYDRNGASIFMYHERKYEQYHEDGIWKERIVDEPFWTSTKPSHWAYINKPIFED